MAVKFPQSEAPRGIRGGSDTWDQPQASVVLLDDFFETASAPASIEGALSATLGAVTLASAGSLTIDGDLAATLAALTTASASSLVIDGDAAGTLASLTLSSVGNVEIAGTLSATLADVTASAAGEGEATAITGGLAVTLDGVTLVSEASGVVSAPLVWRNWQSNRYSRRSSPAEARKPKKRRKVTAAATEEAIEVIKADHVGAWAMVVDTGVKGRLPKTVLVPKANENTDAELARAIANWLIAEAQREEEDIEMLLLAA